MNNFVFPIESWNDQVVATMGDLNQQPSCNKDSKEIGSVCQHFQGDFLAAAVDSNGIFGSTQLESTTTAATTASNADAGDAAAAAQEAATTA